MARDIYIDGRVLVSGAKGHLNLGNPVSLTQSILQVIIPNIPALAVLPYTFQNGLTETVGTPSIVELGGTLLQNTTINGAGFELQLNANTLSNNTIDYQIGTENYTLHASEELFIQNSVFNASCDIDFYLEAKENMDVRIDGNVPSTLNGSKMTIEGFRGDFDVAAGTYNLIYDCNPYVTMQQSYRNGVTGYYGVSSVTANDGVEINYRGNNGISDTSTSISLEGSVVIEASDLVASLSQKIVVSNDKAPVFSGVNDVTTNLYSYEFPNTTPNNGDIMIADGTGKLQYRPNEINIQALNIITGTVGQIAKFHIPFIQGYVCTRINFISESTSTGTITVSLIDELNGVFIGNYDLVIDNVSNYWGGTTPLTAPFTSSNTNNMWTISIVSNTQSPSRTALYLNLTFVPELV